MPNFPLQKLLSHFSYGAMLSLSMAAGSWQSATAQPTTQTYVQPDATFGTNGSISLGLPGSGGAFSETATAQFSAYYKMGQVVQANNRYWVCGGAGQNAGFVIKCYLASGQPDTSFGTNGVLTIAFPYPADVRTLALQPDGMLVAAGAVHGQVVDTPGLARFSQAGGLDPTFGTGGVVAPNPNASTLPNLAVTQLVVLTNGNLLVAGNPYGGGNARLVCLLPNGQLNMAFNNGLPYANLTDTFMHQMLRQPDGRVLLVGMGVSTGTGGPFHNPAVVLRLTAAGLPDASFGTGGVVRLNGTQTSSGTTTDAFTEAFAADVQADGKIVVAGRVHYDASVSVGNMATLLRLLPNGAPDVAFNTAANRTLNNTSGLSSVSVQADGTILVAGAYGSASGSGILVARYTSTGTLDGLFNPATPGGFNYVPAGAYVQAVTGGRGEAGQLLVQPDGKLVVIGGFELLAGQLNGLRMSRYQLARGLATRGAAEAALGLQAAPVPATGPVQLRYTLPASASVRLVLRDQLGRNVAGLPASQQPAGPHQLSLNTQGLATGIYFCTLEAGELSQTIRLAVGQ